MVYNSHLTFQGEWYRVAIKCQCEWSLCTAETLLNHILMLPTVLCSDGPNDGSQQHTSYPALGTDHKHDTALSNVGQPSRQLFGSHQVLYCWVLGQDAIIKQELGLVLLMMKCRWQLQTTTQLYDTCWTAIHIVFQDVKGQHGQRKQRAHATLCHSHVSPSAR